MVYQEAAIVYSTALKLRRRFIITDQGRQDLLRHAVKLSRGEAFLIVSLPLCKQIGIDKVLEKHLGQKKVSDRCAVVDAKGVVMDFICADPVIDRHPKLGHSLVHDPKSKARIGDFIHRVNLG